MLGGQPVPFLVHRRLADGLSGALVAHDELDELVDVDAGDAGAHSPTLRTSAATASADASGSAGGAAAVTASGGKAYVMGGYEGAYNVNRAYDPAANTWATRAVMPTPRTNVAAAATGDKLYVLGGYNGGSADYGINEEYDPGSNDWVTKASMPTVRYMLAAAAFGGKVYAVGGSGSTASDVYNVNEEYNPGSNTWLFLIMTVSSMTIFPRTIIMGLWETPYVSGRTGTPI